jgi:heptosyltransferase-2
MTQRILIRTPNHLGDCIMAMPAINETREAYENSAVSVLTPAPLADLFQKNPAIDHIIPIPVEHVHGLMAVVKIRALIETQEDFDLGYILPPSFGAAASFKLAGIPTRIGYIADGRRLLLTRPLPLPEPLNAEHRSELYFNMLRRGCGRELAYVKPKLFLDDEDAKQAASILESFAIDESRSFVAVACRAVAESRRWGLANYTTLAQRLVHDVGMPVVLIGGPDDAADGNTIVAAVGEDKVVNLAGKTKLRESAAILSRASLFVGNDSGPAHLAASVGCPIVVLSGADDPRETSPMSNRKRLLYLDNLDCISCVKNKGPLTGAAHMACMKGITVEMVLSAVSDLLYSPTAS